MAASILLSILPALAEAHRAEIHPSPAALEARPDEAVLGRSMETLLLETDLNKRLEGLADLAANLSLEQIPDALDLVSGLDELRERMVFHESTLVRWSELDPENAFHHISRLPESRQKVSAIRSAALHLLKLDPERAAVAAAKMSPGAARNEVIPLVARQWAESALQSALDWAESLPDGWAREAALEEIRYVWVHADPISASSHVEQLPPGRTTDNLILTTAYAWALFHPEAAIQWVSDLPVSPGRNEALVSIAEAWAHDEPKAAVAYALELPGEDMRLQAAALAAKSWARQDPFAAIEWFWRKEDLDIEVRAHAAASVLEVWAPVDPAGSGDWIAGREPGPARDRLIAAYTDEALNWAPEIAARLAMKHSDDRDRVQRLDRILRRWEEIDRAASTEWLLDADVPDETKSRLLGSEISDTSVSATGEEEGEPWWDKIRRAERARADGDLANAEEFALEAVDLAGLADSVDERTARSFTLLGDIYRGLEKDELAEEAFAHALSSMERAVGPNHRDLVPFLERLAGVFEYRSQHERLVPVYERILKLMEDNLQAGEYGRIAERAHRLARLHHTLGAYEEADTCYRRAMRWLEPVVDISRADARIAVLILEEHAAMLKEIGDPEEAQTRLARAESIRKYNLENDGSASGSRETEGGDS